jgi:alkylhydroperoxidase/carboxymuconolactone decarboxylase family protein YurZ
MRKLDPALMQCVENTTELVFADGAVPRRLKLLIAMAFDAAHGAVNGVRSLGSAAIQAGATREEIAEVLRVAYHLSGVGALYVASAGLKELLP